MNFKNLFTHPLGITLISILLGLGLASIFHKTCTEKNCIRFNGPILSEFKGKIFRHGDKCYKYDLVAAKCNENKKIVEMVTSPITE